MNNKLLIFIVALALPLMSCSDNSSNNMDNEDPATLSVEGQGTSNGNMVTIAEATVNESSWVVIHRASESGNGPMVPDIIGKAQLEAGTNSNISIQLEESVSDGEQLWAMLHQDTGVEGEYEFTGSDSPDQPIAVEGDILTKPFMISQTDPAIVADDQVNQSNTGGTFNVMVDAAEDGWIVIHRSNSNGDGPMVPDIIGKTAVEAGENGTVQISLNDGETVEDGEKLWPMLHYDTGTEGEYEFDGQSGLDQPVPLDGSIVITSFTVQANQSTLTAGDQMLMDNSISVDVDADANGWVVVHRTNAAGDGPMVPDIIGKTDIEQGMNTDVSVSFDSSVVKDGEQLWPMVHYDTGEQGTYEFDGNSGLDEPMLVAGGILTTSMTVSGATPTVSVNDQMADSDIVITEAKAMQRGFVVIHRNTTESGSDGPDVTGIIGKADIYTGTNGELTIDLGDNTVESEEKLWAMLHIDSNDNGTYDFDSQDDPPQDPPVTDDNGDIVMVQFTVN